MNELELFELWFDKQNRWVIKEKTPADFGKIPFFTIKKSYEKDRDNVIMEEIILKMINENEENKYCNNECLAKNIVKKVRELEKDAW